MPLPDLSHLLKTSARLIDLHDSWRAYAESPVYQKDTRTGHGDGRYVGLAIACLAGLHELGRRSGDEYSPLALISQQVRTELPWAEEVDIEYVLNVLSRPTELKLLLQGVEGSGHVISEKDTNLADKASNVAEFRLSRMGRMAIGMAASSDDDHQDILYIEGDVTKLIVALERGRLKAALGFLDQMNEQLRVAHSSLVSLMERGGRALRAVQDELKEHTSIMTRTNELVRSADNKINEIIRSDIELDDDEVPIGLVRERVRELSRGIVRYSRQLSQLSAETSRGISSSVEAPSFAAYAQKWVTNPPTDARLNQVFDALGPTRLSGIAPVGTDFVGAIKQRVQIEQEEQQVDMNDYVPPLEHEYIRWLQENRVAIEARILNGGLALDEAIADGLAGRGDDEAFACLVTAMNAIESWTDLPDLALSMREQLTKFSLPEMDLMFSGLSISADQSAALATAKEK
ncbi:hypothetical protein [Undibacterium sp. TS12]|uniref:hypothetical protein n=1 Tax=Undibacterium sp. TS12 TaxID=2908202 RepID=UPI001F4C919E|nr:hypothetical protein [Undibacterium sp. TS12]MCH8618145.1 hypothetical protein [Undibacterium sp. TS12]